MTLIQAFLNTLTGLTMFVSVLGGLVLIVGAFDRDGLATPGCLVLGIPMLVGGLTFLTWWLSN